MQNNLFTVQNKQRLVNRRSRAATTEIYLSSGTLSPNGRNDPVAVTSPYRTAGDVASSSSSSSTVRINHEHTALAEALLERYCRASTQQATLSCFNKICALLKLRPTDYATFYPRLKQRLNSWRAKSLWTKFDRKFAQKEYSRGAKYSGLRVLIIGGGPCGLRMSIEAALLGCKVVVVEKRDSVSRNNVLHLWPFVIADLKQLGAKKFCVRFCSGAIDHISIRQLQLILLKAALLLGVEFRHSVVYEELVEPVTSSPDGPGWRARFSPATHWLNQYEFDVLIGADGKRNTLSRYFTRKEFRGKLAIGITINFVNKHTQREQRVAEISGVAFIFNQQFFLNMREQTGIDLENIVYYKNDTHYFVMTAKKPSLLEQGVLKHDCADTIALLSAENVNQDALLSYARRAAAFATNNELAHVDFAYNHYGEPDVAMFDFTSMFQAEHACRIVERSGRPLLMSLVGDSLLEPFWPMGTGAGRGFLACFDTAWMMRSYASGRMTPLQVLAERETTYRLLAQTTPDNISKRIHHYTIDPQSRYPTLNAHLIKPAHVLSLYDSDCTRTPDMTEASAQTLRRMRTYTNTSSPHGGRNSARRSRLSMPKAGTAAQQFEWTTLLDWLQECYDECCLNKKPENQSLKSNTTTVVEIGAESTATAESDFMLKPKTLTENDITARLLLQCVIGRYRPEFISGFEAAIAQETEDDCAKFLALVCVHELGFVVRSSSSVHHSRTGSGVSCDNNTNMDSNDENLAPPEQNSSAVGIDLKFLLTQMYATFRWEQVFASGEAATQLQRHLGIDDAELWADYEQLVVRRQEPQQQNNFAETLQARNFSSNKRKSPSLHKRDETEPSGDDNNENEDFVTSETTPHRSDHVSSNKRAAAASRRSECLENVNISERRKLLVESLAGTMMQTHDAGQRRRSRQPPQIKRRGEKTTVTLVHSSSVNSANTSSKLDLDRIQHQLTSRQNHHDNDMTTKKAVTVTNPQVFDAVKSKLLMMNADDHDVDETTSFDKKLKKIEQQLNGELLAPGVRGNNRVAAMTNTYVNKIAVGDGAGVQNLSSSPSTFVQLPNKNKTQSKTACDTVTIGADTCFFCHRRVYVVERHAAEGLMFHRACFKCAACGVSLRANAYAYNKMEQRFYCLAQHAHLAEVTAETLARMMMEANDESRNLQVVVVNENNINAGSEVQQSDSEAEAAEDNDVTITESNGTEFATKTPERAGFELRHEHDEDLAVETDGFDTVMPTNKSTTYSKPKLLTTSLRRSQSAVDERAHAAARAAAAARATNGVTVSGGSRAAYRRIENDEDFFAVEGAEPLDKRGWHKLGDNYFYRSPKTDGSTMNVLNVDGGGAAQPSKSTPENSGRSPLFVAKQALFLAKHSPARQFTVDRQDSDSSSTTSSDDDGEETRAAPSRSHEGVEDEEFYYSGRETVEQEEAGGDEASADEEENADDDGYAYYAPSVSPPDFVRNSPDAFYRREDFPPSPPELIAGGRRSSTPVPARAENNVSLRTEVVDDAVVSARQDGGKSAVRMKKSNSDHQGEMLKHKDNVVGGGNNNNVSHVTVYSKCYNSLPEFDVSANSGNSYHHDPNLRQVLGRVRDGNSSYMDPTAASLANDVVVSALSPSGKATSTTTISFNQQNLQPSVVTVMKHDTNFANESPSKTVVNVVQRTASAPLTSTPSSIPITMHSLPAVATSDVKSPAKVVASSSPPPATAMPSRPAGGGVDDSYDNRQRENITMSPITRAAETRREQEVISPASSSITSSTAGSGTKTAKTLRETNGMWDPSVVETSKRLREMRARSRQSYDHDEPVTTNNVISSFSPSPWASTVTTIPNEQQSRRPLSPGVPSSLDLNNKSKRAGEASKQTSSSSNERDGAEMLYFDQLRTPVTNNTKQLSIAVDAVRDDEGSSFRRVPSPFPENTTDEEVFLTPRGPNETSTYFSSTTAQPPNQQVFYTAMPFQQPTITNVGRDRFYTAQQSRQEDEYPLSSRRRSQSSSQGRYHHSSASDEGVRKNLAADLSADAGAGQFRENNSSAQDQLLWKDELVRQHEEARQRARERARLKSDAEMRLLGGSNNNNGSGPSTPKTPLVTIRSGETYAVDSKHSQNSIFYVDNDKNRDVVTIRPAPGDSSQMRTRFQQHMAPGSAVTIRKRDTSSNNGNIFGSSGGGEQHKKPHKDQQHEQSNTDSQEKRRSLLDIFKNFGRSAPQQTAVSTSKPTNDDRKQRQFPVTAPSNTNFYYIPDATRHHNSRQKPTVNNENVFVSPSPKATVVPTVAALSPSSHRSGPHADSESGSMSTGRGVSSPEAAQTKQLSEEQVLVEREYADVRAQLDALGRRRDAAYSERQADKMQALTVRARVLRSRRDRIEILKETDRTRRHLRQLLLLDEGSTKSREHIEEENALLERLLELRKQLSAVDAQLADSSA